MSSCCSSRVRAMSSCCPVGLGLGQCRLAVPVGLGLGQCRLAVPVGLGQCRLAVQ